MVDQTAKIGSYLSMPIAEYIARAWCLKIGVDPDAPASLGPRREWETIAEFAEFVYETAREFRRMKDDMP